MWLDRLCEGMVALNPDQGHKTTKKIHVCVISCHRLALDKCGAFVL